MADTQTNPYHDTPTIDEPQEEGVLSREDMQPHLGENPQEYTNDSEDGVLEQEDQQPKVEFDGNEIHTTSSSIGKVVSENATDAAGQTPADLPNAERDPEGGVLGDEEQQEEPRQTRRSSQSAATSKARSKKS